MGPMSAASPLKGFCTSRLGPPLPPRGPPYRTANGHVIHICSKHFVPQPLQKHRLPFGNVPTGSRLPLCGRVGHRTQTFVMCRSPHFFVFEISGRTNFVQILRKVKQIREIRPCTGQRRSQPEPAGGGVRRGRSSAPPRGSTRSAARTAAVMVGSAI